MEFLDNNDCTNDFFLAACPILSLDQHDGVLPGGFNSPEHMAQTWESSRGCSTFLTKGEKIKAARWFKFNRRTRDMLSTAPSLLLMIPTSGRWTFGLTMSTRHHLVGCWVERSFLMTIRPLVTRTKRTVDVLRARQEMSVRSLLVVQSHREACSLRIGDIEQQRASKEHTLAYVADILSCRSTRAMTVVIVDVSLPLEVEAGKTCRYMESSDGVFSWYLKIATVCELHATHECVDAAHSEFLAQRMGTWDEALECMLFSEATI